MVGGLHMSYILPLSHGRKTRSRVTVTQYLCYRQHREGGVHRVSISFAIVGKVAKNACVRTHFLVVLLHVDLPMVNDIIVSNNIYVLITIHSHLSSWSGT